MVYFNSKIVALAIKELQKTDPTPALSLFGKTKKHFDYVVGIDAVKKIAQAVPVVLSGHPSVPIGSGSGSRQLIAPMPIDVSNFITARKILEVKARSGDALPAILAAAFDDLNMSVTETKNALACLTLNGKVKWKAKVQGGNVPYKIDFTNGAGLATTTVTGTWANAATKLSSIVKDLEKMKKELRKKGHSGSGLVFFAGAEAYAAVMDKIISAGAGKFNASVNGTEINLQGNIIRPQQFDYLDIDGTSKTVIADKEVRLINTAAPFTKIIMPVEDPEAKFKPLPVFFKTRDMDEPAGAKNWAKANTLYVPVVTAILKAENVVD